jgi:hypothetical protein
LSHRRDAAIQSIAGYVWAECQATGTSTPNTRRPPKDGYYEHAQSCLEYIVLAFGPTAERKPKRPGYEALHLYQGLCVGSEGAPTASESGGLR